MRLRPDRHQLLAAFVMLASSVGGASAVRADVVELVDKSKVAGKLLHYYDGVFSIETANGTVKIPKEKVRGMTFSLPPARPELATPEKTFERWRKALADGELDKVIDCYALIYQGMLATQMGLAGGQAADAIKKMQKELAGTKFQIKGSAQKGDTATLKVQRQKDDASETGDVAFVRENGEWKMLPPQ